jgi:hypothetical protein
LLSELCSDLAELQDEIASRSEEALPPPHGARPVHQTSLEELEVSIAATGAAVERARFEMGQAGAMLAAAVERLVERDAEVQSSTLNPEP